MAATWLSTLSGVVAVTSLAGCGGDQGGAQTAADARIRRPTAIVLEQCSTEGAGVDRLDADGDGKPEISRRMSGKLESCRVADLNFDGKADRTTYFDEAGHVRRIETDFDRDGGIDEIALFKAGVLSERDRATTLAGRLDTWEFYEAGKLARTERDSDGDGIIDQWWEYPNAECPLIHSDSDGDGRPNPAATIDYCAATGYVPPPQPGDEKPAGVSFSAPVPEGEITEVSNVAADGSGGAPTSGGSVPATGGSR